MLVSEIMTKNVIKLKKTDNMKTVLSLIKKHRISGFPVVDNENRVIGVVSETDILEMIDKYSDGISQNTELLIPVMLGMIRKGQNFEAMQKHMENMLSAQVAEFMKTGIISVDAQSDVQKASELMCYKEINRLPVTSYGKLVGIVTRSDIISAIAKKK